MEKTKAAFRIGRNAFAKISEVEGIHLSNEMRSRFADFDTKGLSPAERREQIAKAYGKKG
jgi:hypothetical protein